MKNIILLLFGILFLPIGLQAQCTEAKDADMAKYKRLTETQDAQGCSECAMLSLYFCSAKYCVKPEDRRKVDAMITACKRNIKTMGQPYCCPELVDKEPQWGIGAGSTASNSKPNTTASSNASNTPTSGIVPGNSTKSNTTGNDAQVINSLAKGIASNPNNPLQINNSFLNTLSGALPDGALKNALQSYGSNLGSDADISYRQIYQDVRSALEQNPSLSSSNPSYARTNSELSALFGNTAAITDALQQLDKKGQLGNTQNNDLFQSSISGTFGGTTPSIGNFDAAMGLAGMLTNAYNEDQIAKENYTKLALKSKEALYAEVDPSISMALIDANLGIEGNKMITPIYRYDFNNGSSLRVESGILKFIDPKNSLSKNLALVERRNNGQYYGGTNTGGWGNTAVFVSENDSLFYVYVEKKTNADVKCNDCLKSGGYVIDATNGRIIFSSSKIGLFPVVADLNNAKFDVKGNLLYYGFYAHYKAFWNYEKIFKEGEKITSYYNLRYINNSNNFVINDVSKKFTDFVAFGEPIFSAKQIKYHYAFEKDSSTINLYWTHSSNETLVAGDGTRYASSMLQICNAKKIYNEDVMLNEVTGLAMSRNGDLYVAGRDGGLGKLAAADYALENQHLQAQLRGAMKNKLFPVFDFVATPKYKAKNGNLDKNRSYPVFPSLKFTPDEQWLVYTIKDKLYLVSPENFNIVHSYTLSFQPYGSFFSKENGQWTLNLMGVNEFMFPVVKKYSVARLSQKKDTTKYTPSASRAATAAPSPAKTGPANDGQTIVDQLKKLKELYDTGVLTKEEFSLAKSKLLKSDNTSGK